MPIVNVEIVLRPDEVVRKAIATEPANELGEIFQSPPAGTWVKVRELSAECYAENGGTSHGVYPIFVSITKSKLSEVDELGEKRPRLPARSRRYVVVPLKTFT